MIRYDYPYFSKKYLYEVETNILHYLVNEKDECNIDALDKELIDMYSSLNEGSLMMDHPVYQKCPHCMGE